MRRRRWVGLVLGLGACGGGATTTTGGDAGPSVTDTPGRCPLPPEVDPPAPAPCTAAEGTAITSLPYEITASGSYCLAVDGVPGDDAGITIKADDVVLYGQHRTLHGAVDVTNQHRVELIGVRSTQGMQLHADDVGSAGELVVRDAWLSVGEDTPGGGGALFAFGPIAGLRIENSRLACACDQASDSSICASITSETLGEPLSPLVITDTVMTSDCVKTLKLTGGATAGGASPVDHRLTDNFFVSTRDAAGDEVTVFTWRNAPGAVAARNTFARNSVVGLGNANAMYLRDDLDNVDVEASCFEVVDPSNHAPFYAAIMTSSGNDAPSSDPSGLRFIGNRVYATTVPALVTQGYEENPPADANRTELIDNVFVSRDDAAVRWGGHRGALIAHNTFLSRSATSAALAFDGDVPMPRPTELFDNIYACANAREGTRHDCLSVPGGQATHVGGHNLYFNTETPDVEVFFAGQLLVATWLASGGEAGSLIGDPRFVDIAACDVRLRPDSPALGQARDGTTIGARLAAP